MVNKNYNKLSDCCGAAMYDDSDICPECKEHCGYTYLNEDDNCVYDEEGNMIYDEQGHEI